MYFVLRFLRSMCSDHSCRGIYLKASSITYELEPDSSNSLRKGAKICSFRDEIYELKCRNFLFVGYLRLKCTN